MRRALTDIAEAAEGLRADRCQQRLTVTALPSLTVCWLAPRLEDFIRQHPDIEVMLKPSNQLADFTKNDVDVGIRFGFGSYPGLVTEKLMDDCYYPLASPALNGGKLPSSPHELGAYRLLRCEGEEWLPSFRIAGVTLREPSGGLVFQDTSMLVRAATEGQGIALARHVIAATALEPGKLVRLFDITLTTDLAYYFVCLPGALYKPKVQAFRSWLFGEIGKLKAINSRLPCADGARTK